MNFIGNNEPSRPVINNNNNYDLIMETNQEKGNTMSKSKPRTLMKQNSVPMNLEQYNPG